jgi:hypothetical protein
MKVRISDPIYKNPEKVLLRPETFGQDRELETGTNSRQNPETGYNLTVQHEW